MAKKEYGVYLKDGKFIKLFGGICGTSTGAIQNIQLYINESMGDDFIPYLNNIGDVQEFASGAKMKLIRWDNNREFFLQDSAKRTMGNAIIELYGNSGDYIGNISIMGINSTNATVYNKAEFVVGVNNYYNK